MPITAATRSMSARVSLCRLHGLVIIYSVATGSLNGIEIAFGFGLAVFGLVLSVISKRVGNSSLYTEPMMSHGDAGTA